MVSIAQPVPKTDSSITSAAPLHAPSQLVEAKAPHAASKSRCMRGFHFMQVEPIHTFAFTPTAVR
jgi:hypothetical protein